MVTFKNKMLQIPFSAKNNNIRNEELIEFVEKIIKENCSLKKEIILKEKEKT